PSADRGVFKTTDAGRSWQKVLFVDTLTGAVDLVMDPNDPNTLYAATYQRLRSPWGMNGGGPGSAIHKTGDGGATWRMLTNGIPAGDKGRIGLAIARGDGRILNATIEHPREAGTYRTEDGGETWRKMSSVNPRPMYYSSIYLDPSNDRRVWVLGTTNFRSEDAGRTFRNLPASPVYDVGLKTDHHALWIDPRDGRHVLLGGDGGLHESWDMGETWNRLNNFAIGQFYAIAVDKRDPYWVYGGMQDNHSWMGPSATRHWLGIINEDWKQIGFGDGMYQQPDPFSSRFVYSSSQNANMQRVDVQTGDRLDVVPNPPAAERPYRFDWTAPIVASQHTAGTVYLGGNRLFISKDRGHTWSRTADLTRHIDRDTLRLMGVLGRDIAIARNDGESSFGEITTISESPVDPRVLWVGTDDGNVQVTRDGGLTWTNVAANFSGVPNGTFVTRVVASGAARGTAYVAFDGHRQGNFTPYLYRSVDFGKTWTPVVNGLPNGNPLRTVHEWNGKAHVLFAGTEFGLYVSSDSAATWRKLGADLPTTRYDDVLIHPATKDLVIGTHGRSIWILDDARPIADWSPRVASAPAYVFPIREATIVQFWEDYSNRAQGAYAGENPPDGAIIHYHLSQPATDAKLTVSAPNGKVVRSFSVPGEAGVIQRAVWDLRHDPPPFQPDTTLARRKSLPVPPHVTDDRGPFVSPGMYTVTIQAGGAKASQTVRVKGDPMLPITLVQHRERETFLLEVRELQRDAATMLSAIAARRRQSGAAADSAEMNRLSAVQRRLQAGNRSIVSRLNGLAGSFNGDGARQGSLYPPTATHRAELGELRKAMGEIRGQVPSMPAR
ncbi:MAG: WD40/YVTN/BNR-like repeat-containing protein, partial [Gemmatimonadaceae bacterium]